MDLPPPRVFCKKRLQLIENKGRQGAKKRQERKRGGNRLKTKGQIPVVGSGQRLGRREVRDIGNGSAGYTD